MTTRLKALVVAVIYSLLAWMLIVHVVANFAAPDSDEKPAPASRETPAVVPPAPSR